MNPKETLLIITSSVFASSPLTKISNPQTREYQYVESILFYLNETNINKIILCDNSGFDYSKYNLQKIALQKNKEIEVLAFVGEHENVAKWGIGFGEGEILKYVLVNSKLIKQNDTFFKVSGRIIIKNLNRIIKKTNYKSNYFNQIRSRLIFPENKVDTRFYFCQKSLFINTLYDSYKNVNDPQGYYLEHSYYDDLKNYKRKFSDFRIIPNYQGVSGTLGIKYSESLIKRLLKQFLRVIYYR